MLNQISLAAKSLYEYIDKGGCNMAIISAQIELMRERLEVMKAAEEVATHT